MKTPMQELIENLEVFLGQGMSYSEWKKLTYGGKTSIEKYLDREKEVIEDIIDIIDSENSGQSAEQRLSSIKEYLKAFDIKK